MPKGKKRTTRGKAKGKQRGHAVKIKGFSYKKKGKTIHVKGYKRGKPGGKKG